MRYRGNFVAVVVTEAEVSLFFFANRNVEAAPLLVGLGVRDTAGLGRRSVGSGLNRREAV